MGGERDEEGRRRGLFRGFGMEKVFLKREEIFEVGDFFRGGVKILLESKNFT